MTDLKIAEYYGVSPATLRNYKKGTAEKQRLYAAMRAYVEDKTLLTRLQEKKKILKELTRIADTQRVLADRVADVSDLLTTKLGG